MRAHLITTGGLDASRSADAVGRAGWDGPPGTGKSRLARHIAAELGLEPYFAHREGRSLSSAPARTNSESGEQIRATNNAPADGQSQLGAVE